MRRPSLVALLTTTLATSLALVLPVGAAPGAAASAPAPPVADAGTGAALGARLDAAAERARVPQLRVTRRVTGLRNPWDVQPLPGGRLLISERDTARLLVAGKRGGTRAVRFPSRSVWVSGETGLMGLEVDPRFGKNRRFYTCSGWRTGSGTDVRVIAWRLSKNYRTATRARTLVAGFPTTSGRHGGCRLLVARDGSLVVGTGDAAVGTNPRDLDSLGGKTLRLNRLTGAPWPSNPFARASGPRRYVLTYGHRNVQGLAQRADGSLWSVEHGSFRDDEVNLLRPGGDYGWNPVPGYDESVPMTDPSLPGPQVAARWRSGTPTIAPSGAVFVQGRRWGALNGTMAMAVLGAQRMVFLRFDGRGRLQRTTVPPVLTRFGRLRSVTAAPNGDLLVTTDASPGAVLRVRPASR